jgi:hypothetical protein
VVTGAQLEEIEADLGRVYDVRRAQDWAVLGTSAGAAEVVWSDAVTERGVAERARRDRELARLTQRGELVRLVGLGIARATGLPLGVAERLASERLSG